MAANVAKLARSESTVDRFSELSAKDPVDQCAPPRGSERGAPSSRRECGRGTRRVANASSEARSTRPRGPIAAMSCSNQKAADSRRRRGRIWCGARDSSRIGEQDAAPAASIGLEQSSTSRAPAATTRLHGLSTSQPRRRRDPRPRNIRAAKGRRFESPRLRRILPQIVHLRFGRRLEGRAQPLHRVPKTREGDGPDGRLDEPHPGRSAERSLWAFARCFGEGR